MLPALSTVCVTACFAFVITAQQVCNNAAALCSRTYDNITYLGAHDSPFVRTPANNYTISGDQLYNSTTQLDSGVRLLTVQVHRLNGEYRLCHTLCQLLDAGTFQDWLSLLKGWLDGNPNEVVTVLVVNSDNADAGALGGLYQAAQIDSYSYKPDDVTQPLKQWPTLNDMISQNKRLVTFVASLDAQETQAAPYLLDEYTFAFETGVNNIEPSDFTCGLDRPPSLNGDTAKALSMGMLPLVNHFRYDDINGIHIPSVENVETTNAASGGPGNLGDEAAACSALYKRAPTFILVDFENVGPAIATVDKLNGVTGQTQGRLSLPDTVGGSKAMPIVTGSSEESGSTSSSQSSMSSTSTGTSTSGSGSAAPASSTGASTSAGSKATFSTLWHALFPGLAIAIVFLLS